jgi:hypothetical protein
MDTRHHPCDPRNPWSTANDILDHGLHGLHGWTGGWSSVGRHSEVNHSVAHLWRWASLLARLGAASAAWLGSSLAPPQATGSRAGKTPDRRARMAAMSQGRRGRGRPRPDIDNCWGTHRKPCADEPIPEGRHASLSGPCVPANRARLRAELPPGVSGGRGARHRTRGRCAPRFDYCFSRKKRCGPLMGSLMDFSLVVVTSVHVVPNASVP